GVRGAGRRPGDHDGGGARAERQAPSPPGGLCGRARAPVRLLTPGMLMTSYAFLKKHPKPSEDEIRWGISGNLCRCTGYVNIVKAIQHAAAKLSQGDA